MNVAIIGHFSFGDSSAASLRVRGIASALQIRGHEVLIVDHATGAPEGGSPWRAGGEAEQSFAGVSLDHYRDGLLGGAPRGIRGLFLGDTAARWLAGSADRPDLVIFYGTHLGFLLRLQPLCTALGIPLVLDVVEWYAPQDLPGGRLGPYALSNAASMRWRSTRVDGILAISRRLERHYLKAGLPVLRVPPLFEPAGKTPKWSASDGEMHLCYAGSPGKKEAFDVISEAMAQARAAGARANLDVIGMGEEQWRAMVGETLADGDGVRCWGRVPNTRAREIVSACDFSLVVRRHRRSNQFGFPSKCAESLALGTPVIANRFSDLAEELGGSEAALILQELSPKALTAAIIAASRMPQAEREARSGTALTLAAERFSPRAHAGRLSEFLESLVQ